jgi:hypothetical protein
VSARQALLVTAILSGLFAASGGKAAAEPHQPRVFKAVAAATGPGSIATAAASCPKENTKLGHWRAVSGGFKIGTSSTPLGAPPPLTPVVYESRREGSRSWRVSAQSLSNGVDLTVYVNCQRQVPKPRAISSAVVTPGQPRVGPTAIAQCPTGRAVAGGFSTPLPFTPFGAANTVVGSFPNGTRQWRAQVVSNRPSSVRSFVYCAERNRKPKLTGAAEEPTSVATAAGTVVYSPQGFTSNGLCPAARFAPGGGGFRQYGMTPTDYLIPIGLSQRPKRAVPPARTFKGNVWQAVGLKVGSGSPVRLQAVAICG